VCQLGTFSVTVSPLVPMWDQWGNCGGCGTSGGKVSGIDCPSLDEYRGFWGLGVLGWRYLYKVRK